MEVGDVVQLNPETVGNKAFAGCFLIVTEVRSWGAIGYVQALGTREAPGGLAFYRARADEMSAPIGRAEWIATGAPSEEDAR